MTTNRQELPPGWQRIYHTTLYRFSREGREDVLRQFRASSSIESATCSYDAEQHHFEIHSLFANSEQAESVLAQVISAYVQGEDDKANEFADYERKATKFTYALLDEGERFDDEASEPDVSFPGDDLIDLSDEPEKSHWLPTIPNLSLDKCFPARLLDAIGEATACSLALDLASSRIQIKPLSGGDVDSARRRLTNAQNLNERSVPIAHSLIDAKEHELWLQWQRLNDNDPAFYTDGTLSRLLFPRSAPIIDVRNFDEEAPKVLERLYVLRPYRDGAQAGTLEAIKTKPSGFKPNKSGPVSRIFKRLKYRKLGDDTAVVTQSQARGPQPPPEATESIHKVETWLPHTTETNTPVSTPQVNDYNTVRGEVSQSPSSPVVPGGSDPFHSAPPVAPSAPSLPNTAGAAAPSAPNGSGQPATRNRALPATSSQSWAQVGAGSAWNVPQSSSAAAWRTAEPTSRGAWNTTAVSSRPQRGSTNRPGQPIASRPSRGSSARGAAAPARQPDRNTMSSRPSDTRDGSRQVPYSRNRHARLPTRPTTRPVASHNPFDQLGDGNDDDDDEGEEGPEVNDGEDDAVREQLAEDEPPPRRMRVNRHRAPAPPPTSKHTPGDPAAGVFSQPVCQDFLKGHCPKGGDCIYKHDAFAYTSSSGAASSIDPSISTDATSFNSIPMASTMMQALRDIKRNNPQSRLSSNSFKNKLSQFHSTLDDVRALQGTFDLTAQLGKIVLPTVPSDSRKQISARNFQDKMEPLAEMDIRGKTFCEGVSSKISDIDGLLATIGISEESEPFHEAAYFEFGCHSSNDKSTVRIILDTLDNEQPAEPFARSSSGFHCAWYNHHPRHFWDSRLALLHHTNYPLDNVSGANEFISNLNIAHNEDLMAPSVTGRTGQDLQLDQIRFITSTRFLLARGWSDKEDLYIEVKRVIEHRIQRSKKDFSNFRAPSDSEHAMIKDQRLWFELSLGLVNPSPRLLQNEPHPQVVDPARPRIDHAEVDALEQKMGTLELYEKADWKPEEVLKAEQLFALQEVANRVVEKMDPVGLKNKGFGADRERKNRERREVELNTPDQFW